MEFGKRTEMYIHTRTCVPVLLLIPEGVWTKIRSTYIGRYDHMKRVISVSYSSYPYSYSYSRLLVPLPPLLPSPFPSSPFQ